VLAARESEPARRLALLAIDSTDADASGDEGVWRDGRLVGFTTSGAYGHHVGMSLALAYVDTQLVDAVSAGAETDLVVDVVGEPRPARILPMPPFDPTGSRLRS
jgi:dimethylglycine dehydrogenase